MRKLVSAVLFSTLVLTGCKSRDRVSPGQEEHGLSLDLEARNESPAVIRDQAIENARSAGALGNGEMGSGAGVTSGFASVDKPGEAYHDWGKNPWTDASKDHLSTFAADVDTASYTIARRKLNEGTLPDPASVRVEEFVNYFRYQFPAPAERTPFAVVMQAAPSPLQAGREILRVGVATKEKSIVERKPAHLVFLVDVSGSMDEPDKLPLAKESLRILTNNLKDGDTVALVTYAGETKLVLKPTGLEHKAQILAAIDELEAAGSTGMASGIDIAYTQAMAGLAPGAISRVIVCTDGDANVGAHTHEEILKIIESRAKAGVTLSTIGFGMGNYKDELMEQLADHGNGNNFYIDSVSAAKKVFQEQLGSTLEVVAKDVKLQVDFDPALVAQYRLVGYEDRDIADNDFRNDKVDAGEVGAGHQVSALYELELTAKGAQANAPVATLRVRYKQPTGETATEAGFPMVGGPLPMFAQATADFRFAFAVAAFADVLRGGQDAEHWSLAQIRDLAKQASGDDPDRLELVGLIDKAIALHGRTAMR
ncbi:MAG TPA: von Willebrand factor type A domain-containing protein [Kofleriaceae bacterium]|nr:von Willebrand factor type A domain-containing protein [Kofleriaceae bacterium]